MKELIVSEIVFSYLKPTILFMKYFGLAPIVYKFENGVYTLKKSTKYMLYSYAIGFALAFWALLGLWMDASSEFSFRVKNKNDIYVTLSDIGGVILSVLSGILLGPLKLEALFNYIHSLDNMNKLLDEPIGILQYDKYSSLFFISLVYGVSTVVIILDLYSWSERTAANQLSVTYVKYYFSFYLFYFVLISQQLAYNNLSYHVKRRVMSLNRILSEEILRRSREKQNDFIFWIRVEKANIIERFVRSNEVVNIHPRRKNNKIDVFPAVYDEVENSIKALNNFFDCPLMFILITCFIHMIITIWGILVSYYTRTLFFVMNIVWIVIQTGRLLFVIDPIHRCLFEMSKTKPLVAKLVTIVDGKDIHNQLNIIVKKMKISAPKFTAACMVNIRRPILTTIMHAVTTYLVILYQLHGMKRVN